MTAKTCHMTLIIVPSTPQSLALEMFCARKPDKWAEQSHFCCRFTLLSCAVISVAYLLVKPHVALGCVHVFMNLMWCRTQFAPSHRFLCAAARTDPLPENNASIDLVFVTSANCCIRMSFGVWLSILGVIVPRFVLLFGAQWVHVSVCVTV